MKVLVENHENEKEKTYKFKCIECGSELEITPNDIVRGCIIPTYIRNARWDMRTWKLNVLGVQCLICNKWYYIDKNNYSIEPVNGDFECDL